MALRSASQALALLLAPPLGQAQEQGRSPALRRQCETPILQEVLPTTLDQAQLQAWNDIDLPGQAPWEMHMDALSDYWDRCARHGGRLWEVPDAQNSNSAVGVCMHRSCSQRQVERRLLPRPNGVAIGMAFELGHWRQLHLDFVLAGYAKCGTSSLSHNLARHTQVNFIPAAPEDPEVNKDDQEAQDGDFFWYNGNRLLPLVQLIDAFNEGRCCNHGTGVSIAEDNATKEKWHGGLLVRGERNPVYAFHRLIMRMIKMVPRAKIILIACDPIGWLHSSYADTTTWYSPAEMEGLAPPPPLAAFASTDMVEVEKVAQPLLGHWYNLSRRHGCQSRMFEGLIRLLGGQTALPRVHLLHRDSVDERLVGGEAVRKAYNRLAEFLGVSPFPASFDFQRRNTAGELVGKSRQRQTTQKKISDLCGPSEAQALQKLRHYYRGEYARMPALLERFGSPVPARVAANRTYCDPWLHS